MRTFLMLLATGVVVAGTAFAAPSKGTVTIKTSSALGAKVLVSSTGMTLYHYTDEAKGKIDCKGPCATLWPPLLAGTGKPVAGPGVVAAKLGTLKRPDGKVQVTYNGLALYRYSADKKPGDVNGQGIERAWYAVTAAGTITRAKASSGGTATPTAGTNAPASSGGGTAGTPAAPADCTPGAMVTDANSPCYNY